MNVQQPRIGVDVHGHVDRRMPHRGLCGAWDPLSREMQNAFKAYEILRFSRRMSFLRSCEPDDEVGYTIMIYRVSDADVTLALQGFPRELLGAPEGKRSK